jgi:hypothetical protein
MDRYILFIAMIVVLVSAVSSDVLADELSSDVSITITKFQVNDQALELGWKIINGSDHDVWICETMNTNAQLPKYETFMAEDAETLVIRRWFDLPLAVWLERPIGGRYVRLRPGQEHIEFLTLPVPVIRDRLFEAKLGNALYAKRLVLEIGFYDEDLPGLLLHIADVAEKLSCDESLLTLDDVEIYALYYEGLWISGVFNDDNYVSAQLRESVIEGSDEIVIPHMGKTRIGEQFLRMTIDNVSIPYRGLSTTDEPPLSETEPAVVTMALSGFDVNDTNLELGWKIKNNTDHDVWICDKYVDTFMDSDNRTLILRTRYNLSKDGVLWEFPFPRFRYSRLHPGQEKVKSYSLDVPVRPDALFETSRGNAEYAERLAVEIGYYDEDLSALFIDIAEMAENLNCDSSTIPPTDLMRFSSNDRLFHRFFGGVEIAIFFNSESFTYFRDSVTAGGDEIIAPYLFQTLNGEKVLRLEVDNVSIPYKSNYPPLND